MKEYKCCRCGEKANFFCENISEIVHVRYFYNYIHYWDGSIPDPEYLVFCLKCVKLQISFAKLKNEPVVLMHIRNKNPEIGHVDYNRYYGNFNSWLDLEK